MKKRKIAKFILKKFIPLPISKSIISLYGILKPPKQSFSQKGEDILVNSFFSKREKGYYLDIGSFHPKWISNTFLLHKAGWYGTAIDIDEYKLRIFKLLRGSRVNTIKSAIVPFPVKNSKVNVYKFFSQRGWSDIDTLDLKTAEKLQSNGRGEYAIEKVNALDINSLLESLPKVDFLNIDIEGLDTQVVNAINLEKFKIDVILFEDNINYGGSPLIRKKLEDNGYFHLFTSGGSVCFALKNKLNF